MAGRPSLLVKTRYHYIDWLRITAFGLLIFYHSARAFFPEDPWHINDPNGSWSIRIAMDLIASWRLPLLFFISGIGSWFILSKMSLKSFANNRLLRLLLPLIFSMLIIIPPQVWLERIFEGSTISNYLSWYFHDAFTQSTYPQGNISWHHLWYIAYLFTMTILLLPFIYPYAKGKFFKFRYLVKNIASGPLILAMVFIPLVVENTLGRIWPEKSNALLGDWGWLSLTATWFVMGFLIAPVLRNFTNTAMHLRWITLGLWIAMSCIIIFNFRSDDFDFTVFQVNFPYDDALTVPIAWLAILTLVGFFSVYFNSDSTIKRYLNEAVYPLYIIHQTVALALVFLVVPQPWPTWQKFPLVAVLTFAISLIFYHFAIRNLGPLKVLFGLRLSPKRKPNA